MRQRVAWFALFGASGTAGLVYQSLWAQYAGLILGHAAYAQAAVLATFMGGMAAGAWWASRRSETWRNPLAVYALLELGIGLAGLLFDPLFRGLNGWSLSTVVPQLSEGWVGPWQWAVAIALMLPPSLLLGATFPALAAGLRRQDNGRDGHALGGLYFANSLGAAAGVLMATFVWLPAWGAPGALKMAALLNGLVALAAWFMARPTAQAPSLLAVPAPKGAVLPWAGVGLSVAFLTGATSFVYEIAWVRLLNQILGTSMHAFEIMLATFLVGLALGGAWVSWRGDRLADPWRQLGWVQVIMGWMALLSLVCFSHGFEFMAWWMQKLSAQPVPSYAGYNAGSALLAMAVMLPTTLMAGMALPLLTLAWLRQGHPERAIGRAYAANTAGAIVGVWATVGVLVPWLGLHGALGLAALVDVAVGVWLLHRRQAPSVLAVGLSLAVLMVAAALGRPNPNLQASGVFRFGQVNEMDVSFYKDGRTATVSVSRSGNMASIATNGKVDAGMELTMDGEPSEDEYTMFLLGVLPLMAHPDPQRVGVIGWGSGLTTHLIAGDDRVRYVETVEIEPVMVEGAKAFGQRVHRAYDSPKSRIHYADARTQMNRGRPPFDVWVSEPSNPWVSGVSGLFTREFYAQVRQNLTKDGVLVQWLHVYELNDALLATMVSALQQEFPQTDVYLHGSDLVFVSYAGRRHPFSAPRPSPELAKELEHMGMARVEQVLGYKVAGPTFLKNFLRAQGQPVHRDLYPTVALGAPKARFLSQRAAGLEDLIYTGFPWAQTWDEPLPGRSRRAWVWAKYRWDWEALETLATGSPTKLIAQIRQAKDLELAVGRNGASQNDMRMLEVLLESTPSTDAQWASAATWVARATQGLSDSQLKAQAWIEAPWAKNLSPYRQTVLRALAAQVTGDPALYGPAAQEALALDLPADAAAHMHVLVTLAGLSPLPASSTSFEDPRLQTAWSFLQKVEGQP